MHHNALRGNRQIKYVIRTVLGAGSQGRVDLVCDLWSGEHYARKELPYQDIPGWGIFSANAFKKKLLEEMDIVEKVSKVRIHSFVVPRYIHFVVVSRLTAMLGW